MMRTRPLVLKPEPGIETSHSHLHRVRVVARHEATIPIDVWKPYVSDDDSNILLVRVGSESDVSKHL
jgi:hypothetical protein